MANVFIAKIKKERLELGSEAHRSMFVDFLRKNEGKEVRIELKKNPVSDAIRGWYFSAILPAIRSVVPEWKKLSDDEMHEVLKKQFEYFDAYNTLTKRVERFGRTVMSNESNTKRAMDFIEKIREYFSENYLLDIPDPSEFKKWRDSAPLKNE